jgi:hypothetical protein
MLNKLNVKAHNKHYSPKSNGIYFKDAKMV